MKLYCNYCKKIIKRDMRDRGNRNMMTRRGYRSYCLKKDRSVFLKPVK